MSVFNNIRNNFVTLMETTIVGKTTNTFKESPFISFVNLPTSVYAGTVTKGFYNVKLKGITQAMSDLNSYLDYEYIVELELGFAINSSNKNSYNTAISDVETIIKNRIMYSTWSSSTSIGNISFVSVDTPTFADKGNNENYMVVSLQFKISGRDTF